jgi:hypothetical protein
LLASKLSPSRIGGGERDRTDDLLLAKQALSQLSYTPDHDFHHHKSLVGLVGLEPTTPRLSSVCSNQLSYRPPYPRGLLKQPIGCEHLINQMISRKEVIQPHLPIRLPCYDFTPVTNPTVAIAPLAVRLTASGRTRSHGVTGGVYKTRERIHRDMLIRDY